MNDEAFTVLSNRAIFMAALEIVDEQERLKYLQTACAGDPNRQLQLEQLLAANAVSDPNLLDNAIRQLGSENTSAGEFNCDDDIDWSNPPTIDRYTLREQIGEGGMGVVYVAEQTDPIRRKVALKVIKPGMVSKDIVARFAAERRTLALMDHPHIARVIDGSMLTDGRPYFVMELVNGIPITEFCSDRKLTNRERLALFLDVCSAIEHAHQKGIIHRDLKPSNVMVTIKDGKPMPKVIDFGISKALDQQFAENTIYTAYGQMVGTPMYMSPEQAQYNAVDVDTRSDVYSLGVLLYELLTGLTPFEKEAFLKSGFDEMRRLIREVTPIRPSQRISTLKAGEKSTISDHRNMNRRKIGQSLAGELDWIVMKALEKDRNRRFQSVSAFAADIRRYLAGEAVQAGPPSNWYRFSKTVRRHRVLVGTVAIVALSIVVGLIGTTTQAFRALRAERLAEERFHDERFARIEADAARERANTETIRADAEMAKAKMSEANAEEEALIASAISYFLQNDLLAQTDIVNQLDSGHKIDPDITLATLLDRASEKIGERFSDLPYVEASIRYTLAQAYMALGKNQPAEAHLQRAVEIVRQLPDVNGQTPPGTYRAIGILGWLRINQGRLPEAESLLTEAYKGFSEGDDPQGEDARTAMGRLIVLRFEQGKYEEAKALAQELLEICQDVLGPEHPVTLSTMKNLATQYDALGQLDKAIEIVRKSQKILERTLGKDHPQTIRNLKSLAVYNDSLGNYVQSQRLFEQVMAANLKYFGPHHPETLAAQANLGHVLEQQSKFDEAETLLVETLEILKREPVPDNHTIIATQSFLASVYLSQNRIDEAAELYQSTLEMKVAQLGPKHPDVISTQANYAKVLQKQGKIREAETQLLECIETARDVLGPEHPITLTFMNNLGVLYFDSFRLQEALEMFEKLLAARIRIDGPNHLGSINVSINKACVLRDLGRIAEAKELLLDAIQRCDSVLDEAHPRAIFARIRLAELLELEFTIPGRLTQAEEIYRRVADIRWRSLGPGHPDTIQTINHVANVLTKQNRAAEAKQFWQTKIDAAVKKLGKSHPHIALLQQAADKSSRVSLDPAAAETDLRLAFERTLESLGPANDQTQIDFEALLSNYLAQRKHEPAETLVRQRIEDLQALPEKQVDSILQTKLRLAEVLMIEQPDKSTHPKTTEAEQILIDIVGNQATIESDFIKNAVERLISLFDRQHRVSEAVEQQKKVLVYVQQLAGEKHPSTLNVTFQLVRFLHESEQFVEAEQLIKKVVQLNGEVQGESHFLTRNSQSELINVYLGQGKLDDALQACQTLIASQYNLPTPSRAYDLITESVEIRIGLIDQLQGRSLEATSRLTSLLELVRSRTSETSFEVRRAQFALANVLQLQGQWQPAEQIYESILATTLAANGKHSISSTRALYGLAEIEIAQQRFEQAEPKLREFLDLQQATEAWQRSSATSMLGESRLADGDFAKAEEYLRAGYLGVQENLTIREISRPERQRIFVQLIDRLIRLFEALKNEAEIEHWKAERQKWLPQERAD